MAEAAPRRAPTLMTAAWLKTLPAANRWILFGDAVARQRAAAVWGVESAEIACRAAQSGARATLWLGPDERLLIDLGNGGDAEAAEATQVLEQALSEVPHSLVNIGHRQFALEVCGPHAEALLSGACPLDLDIGAFPVGMCTRTAFSKADIVLWRIRTDAFHLEVWRSFADYVGGLLSEIALDFYPPS